MPGRLDDDEVEARRLEDGQHVAERLGHLVAAPGGERAEVDAVAVERVHPDAVAEERAATAAAGRVDGDAGDAQLVLLVDAQPADELVGEARLARPARAGDAEHRHPVGGCRALELGAQLVGEVPGLGGGEGAGDRGAVAGEHGRGRRGRHLPQVGVAGADDLVDHAGEAEALAVLGAEDRDPGGAQALDLVGDDDPAATADDLDVAGAGLAQQLDEVLEVLDVAALVGGDGDALDVLLDRGVDDLADAAVVAEVDHLGALALHDPPHDVDRRVVAVEQARGGDDADRVRRHVELGLRGGGLRCHEGSLRGRYPRY